MIGDTGSVDDNGGEGKDLRASETEDIVSIWNNESNGVEPFVLGGLVVVGGGVARPVREGISSSATYDISYTQGR
jgi:hypothetical protein